MSLIDSLAGELLGPKSTKELSKSIGAKPEQIQEAVTAAIPLLVSGMFQNSGTEDGAASLENALKQHAPKAKKSTSAMLREADTEDGRKIVGHVLGKSEKKVTDGLSKASGMTNAQTGQLLSTLAPVVLSLVGNFTQGQQQEQVQEIQQVEEQPSSSSGLMGLLGNALVGDSFQQVQPAQQSGLNLTSLAGALLGGSGQQSGGAGSLLSGLLGGGSASSSQSGQSQGGGLNLSGLLMGLLK